MSERVNSQRRGQARLGWRAGDGVRGQATNADARRQAVALGADGRVYVSDSRLSTASCKFNATGAQVAVITTQRPTAEHAGMALATRRKPAVLYYASDWATTAS